MQSFLYALIQSIHNIGAVVIVGVGAYGLFFAHQNTRRVLAVVQALGWSIQGLTGAAFGATTFYFYHQLPDIHGVAILALLIKISCVVSGFVTSALYVLLCSRLSPAISKFAWSMMFGLGVIAISSAAFLRWYS